MSGGDDGGVSRDIAAIGISTHYWTTVNKNVHILSTRIRPKSPLLHILASYCFMPNNYAFCS